MKAKLLRDMTSSNPEYNKDQAAVNALAGKPYSIPHSITREAGDVIDDPKAYRLVQMGVAIPEDEECEEMSGVDLSEEGITKRTEHYDDVQKGMSIRKKTEKAESK